MLTDTKRTRKVFMGMGILVFIADLFIALGLPVITDSAGHFIGFM